MKTTAKEIEMGAQLIVPTGFGLIGDGAVHLFIVIGLMRHLDVLTRELHQFLPHLLLLGLEDVGEHLQVVATRTETLAHAGINLIPIVAELPTQCHLGQQLLIGGVVGTVEARTILVAAGHGLATHHSTVIEPEMAFGGIVNTMTLEIVAQTECKRERIGQAQGGLMVDAHIQLRRMEDTRHLVVAQADGVGNHWRHAHVLLDHGVHIVAKKYGAIGTQPLIMEDGTRGLGIDLVVTFMT